MDHVYEWLKQHADGKPITRERYLDVAYLGKPPAELTAEQEAELPKELQKNSGEVSTDD
jgi:hypothetical protein